MGGEVLGPGLALRRPLLGAAFIAALLKAGPAFAETPLPAKPEPGLLDRVQVTNLTSVSYSANNRNTRSGSVQSLTDDEWGLLYNRLNLQASHGSFRAGLRVDGAWFPTAPSPLDTALVLTERRRGNLTPPFSTADSQFFDLKLYESGTDLSSRYINWLYPAKLYLGYHHKHVQVTLGDFNAQLGRGLVLSVRKRDEVSSDTTIRGASVTANTRASGIRLQARALAGSLNPLRIDQANGRYLSTNRSVRPGLLQLSELGMPGTLRTDFVPSPKPNYAPDRVFASAFSVASSAGKLSVQTAYLLRQEPLSFDISRSARSIQTSSASLETSRLPGFDSFYFEAATQHLEARASAPNLGLGHALYASSTSIQGPVIITLEAKHYRRFFPLGANVDLARAPEFSALQYNAAPTAEAFWVDTEFDGHNTCVTGGRAKADYSVSPRHTAGVWLGYFQSWAESVANERCHTTRSNLNEVYDLASFFERRSPDGSGRQSLVLGGRLDTTARALSHPKGGTTHLFYGESYARYDLLYDLPLGLSLDLQGWHRRRLQTQGGADGVFFQGLHTTSLDFRNLSFAVGAEYDTDPRTPDTYFNAQLQYRFHDSSNVSLVAGQQRGGLRCVSGVCRVFPPFEGARLDLTTRL